MRVQHGPSLQDGSKEILYVTAGETEQVTISPITRRFLGVAACVLAAAVGMGAVGATAAHAAEVLLRVGDTTVPPGTIIDGDAVVIGGTLDVGGTVTGNATAAGGSVHVSGHVGGDVRAFGGNVILDSTALVGGTVQSAGGSVRIAPGAIIRKAPPGYPAPGTPPAPSVPPMPFPPSPSPGAPSPPPWLFPGVPSWMPPAFFGILAVWKLVGGVLLLLALLAFVGTAWITAAAFPGVTAAVAGALEGSPAASVLAGVLVWLLIAPVAVLLVLSVAGILLVLLLVSALLIAIQLGLSAVAVLVGHRVRPGRVAIEAAVGALLLAIAFAVPHLGWLAGFAATTWGTGGVLVAIVERRHHRGPVPPAPSTPSAPPPPAPASPAA
ncbi:MAG TPA: polymer-forming cytoskeletal protein [bacterium]|nr:polymer-forming cytoskeletal protein [bacterium]